MRDKLQMEYAVLENLKTDNNGRRDLSGFFADAENVSDVIAYLAEPYRGKVDYVAAPEPMGFLIGGMLAKELGVGLIPIRNGVVAPLPDSEVIRAPFIDHRDTARSLQMRKKLLPEGSRVLLADDWIGTAATMHACVSILEDADCEVAGIATLGVENNTVNNQLIGSGFIRSIVLNHH